MGLRCEITVMLLEWVLGRDTHPTSISFFLSFSSMILLNLLSSRRLKRPSTLARFKPLNMVEVFVSIASLTPTCFKNAYTSVPR